MAETEALTYRQMATEIEAIGMEKADTLAKAERQKRAPEMIAVTRYKITALRQIWAVLDRLAKSEEKPEPQPKRAPAPQPDDDDDF